MKREYLNGTSHILGLHKIQHNINFMKITKRYQSFYSPLLLLRFGLILQSFYTNHELTREYFVKGPELVLSHVQRAHAGDYICRADNGVGRGAARETVTLDILRKLSTHYL